MTTQRIDQPVKYADNRRYADPEVAARELMEIAAAIAAVQDGRIHIEKINAPFMYQRGGSGPRGNRRHASLLYYPSRFELRLGNQPV